MNTTDGGILTMDDPEATIHLPPGQTPITSEKRLRRMRAMHATVGFVDDEIMKLARALLVQYGPLAAFQRELMQRLAALEDHLGYTYQHPDPAASPAAGSGDTE